MASTAAVVAQRVSAVLAFDRGQVPATEVEGGPSGLSREIALAQIGGTEQLYRGAGAGGVGDLVRARSAANDERLQAAFAGALRAMQKVGGPLEQAVGTDRAAVEAAGAASKALALSLKTDLANALGVTLKNGAGG
jgi:predicted lipoprotein